MSGNKIKVKDFLPLIVGIVFYLYIILFVYSPQDPDTTYPVNKSCMDKSCQNNENRLKWPFPHAWYAYSFVISLIFLVICVSSLRSKIFLGVFFSITFILAITIYPKSVGSVWCFSTAILTPLAVFGNYYFMNSQ